MHYWYNAGLVATSTWCAYRMSLSSSCMIHFLKMKYENWSAPNNPQTTLGASYWIESIHPEAFGFNKFNNSAARQSHANSISKNLISHEKKILLPGNLRQQRRDAKWFIRVDERSNLCTWYRCWWRIDSSNWIFADVKRNVFRVSLHTRLNWSNKSGWLCDKKALLSK